MNKPEQQRARRSAASLILTMTAIALSACSMTSVRQAPVSDRSPSAVVAPPPAPATTPPPPKPAASAVPEGGYVVKPGDTLYSIAQATGRDWRDLARWNGLEDPTRLSTGQVLKVQPPPGESPAAVVPVAPASPSQARPLDGASVAAAPSAGSATPGSAAPPVAGAIAPGSMEKPQDPAGVPGMNWLWPVGGRVLERFDEKRNKGIDIAGKEGDPVVATLDGQVVYSGSGLRGYGNLVIIKHADDFISAYAHNRQILVKQGQTVKRGQRIAEVGRTDAAQPKLHFEIRRQGKPVDPLQYLPPR